jgi:hypothetical protein
MFSLSKRLPLVDERVFLYGAEEATKEVSFGIREGRIVRLGTGRSDAISAFADIPFKGTYCGAPVLNESKEVVGIVMGQSIDGELEISVAPLIDSLIYQIGH